ncbi:MAG TPA: hypothetical protein VHF25_15205 [Nitriliruptorales bacterium]|nr:hypothetical protein [Nitriliruptorales bacterium]
MTETTVPPAMVALSARGAVEVTGADRVSYLHAVLSQDIEGLEAGRCTGALQLDAQGRPLAMVDVLALGDRHVLLTVDREGAESLAASLASRTFLADARFAPLDVSVLTLRGRDAHGVVVRADLGDVAAGRAVEVDAVIVAGGEDAADVVVPLEESATWLGRLVRAGAEAVDAAAIEAWRIAHGVPGWAREVRAPHLPEEAGVLPTHVHLAKGCYPGQEAVARMWMLGRPRRRLATVLLAGSAGAGWTAGSGKERVEVTSAAEHADERVGLAYVPPSARPGDRFGDDQAGVVVRALVGDDRPVPGHDPTVTRRRDRRASAGQ